MVQMAPVTTLAEDFADANRIEKLLSITFILINMLTGLA